MIHYTHRPLWVRLGIVNLIMALVLSNLGYPWISTLPAPQILAAEESPPQASDSADATPAGSVNSPAPSPLDPLKELEETLFYSTTSAQPNSPETSPEASSSAKPTPSPETSPETQISTPSATPTSSAIAEAMADPTPTPATTPPDLPDPLNLPISQNSTLPPPLDPFLISLKYPFAGTYPISYGFGENSNQSFVSYMQSLFKVDAHDGIDWALPEGTPVLAAASGKVTEAGYLEYGNTIKIDHSFGRTYYGHLSTIYVTIGQQVKQGEIIGLSGNTGITTGPHLHFGLRPTKYNAANGYHGLINPLPYIKNQVLGTQSTHLTTARFKLNSNSIQAKDSSLHLSYNLAPDHQTKYQLQSPKGELTDITDQVLGSQTGPMASEQDLALPHDILSDPGNYTLIANFEDGTTQEEPFTYGLLAINTSQATYQPNTKAQISLAVLDEAGNMVCDASLKITITDPNGISQTLTTNNKDIVTNSEICHSKEPTMEPDYFVEYNIGNTTGLYTLTLTRTDQDTPLRVNDSFVVTNNPSYTIERLGPTRIYPKNILPMVMVITPTVNYQGSVTEQIPEEFIIQNEQNDDLINFLDMPPGTTINSGAISRDVSSNQITWQVDWKAGEKYILHYFYDAPDQSPLLFKLGPTRIGDWQEERPWQIAVDAITYESAGTIAYSASAGAIISPAYPSSISQYDLLVVIVGMKPSVANTGSATTPDGWTSITSLTGAGGYGTTLGADTGNTNVFAYYKVADGGENGTLDIDLTNNGVSWSQIYRFSPTQPWYRWEVAGTTGSDTSSGTGVSIAMSSNPGVTAGDYILGAMVIPTDVTTPNQFSAEGFTQTGVSFGTVSEISEPDTSTGNDMGGVVVRSLVSSGVGTASPTMTATAGGTTTNVRGPGIFIRIREVPVPTPPTFYDDDGGSNQIGFDNARINSNTPIIRASATHTTTFDRFQLEFNTQADFTGTAYTETFSGTYSSATTYNLQTTSSLSLPTTDNTTYFVRGRTSDDSGSNWSRWTTDTKSYTYTSSGNPDWYQQEDGQFEEGDLVGLITSGSQGVFIPETPVVKSYTSASSGSSTASSLTLTKPNNVNPDSLLIIIVGNADNTATAQWDDSTLKPTGFTLINESGNATSDTHTAAFYRIADGTEGSTINVPAQSADYYWGYYIHVVGSNVTTPFDNTSADTNVGSGASASVVGMNTTSNNTLDFFAVSYDGGDASGFTISGTGWSVESEAHAGTAAANSSGFWGTRTQTTSGASGTATTGYTSGSADGWSGFQFSIAPRTAAPGTVMSQPIDFDSNISASTWGTASMTTDETHGDIKLSLYYNNGSDCDTIIPDGALSGNSSGFDAADSPIDISALNTTTYNRICLQATQTYSGGTPYLTDWTVTWSTGATITISGTANGNNGASIRYAYDGVIQSDTSDTISSGTWSIDSITSPSGSQVVTVWIDGVGDTDESTAVTKWSSGDITGMVLDTNVVTVGSNQDTNLSITDLDSYDCTSDEDIMYQAGSSHLKVEGDSCAGSTTNSYSSERLDILSGNSLTVTGSETLTTYDLTIGGTITSGGASTYNIEHNWDLTGTFSPSTSTVNLTGGSGTTQAITGTNTFSTLSATGSSARTITFPSSVTTTVNTSLTLTGASGQLLTLAPGTASTVWTISAPSTTTASYLSVSYSTNSGSVFCATNSNNGGNNTNWTIVSDTTCPIPGSSAASFQRKTWYDGSRYWRSFQDSTNNNIIFEYSSDGSTWTEDSSARIDTDTSDFSVYADSTNAFVAYTTSSVADEDNILTSTSNLVGHWKMDENSWSGTTDEVVDSSGNGNDGTSVGNATTTSSGKFNNAGTFDGSGDYVDMGDTLIFNNTEEFNISAWFYITSFADVNYIVSRHSTNYYRQDYALQVANSTTISYSYDDTDVGPFFTNWTVPTLSTNTWYHISLNAYNDNTVTMYLDGTAYSNQTGYHDDYSSTEFNIGRSYYVGDVGPFIEFAGRLDDVRVYDRALTTNEVATLAQPGYDIEVRKATTYPGTSFAWSNEIIALNGKSSTVAMKYPTITYDTNSKIWVSASQYDTTSPSYTQYAVRSTSANDITAWDASTTLDTSTNASRYGLIVPRASGSAYAIWADGSAIEGKNYNGSAWDGSPTTIDTGLTGLADTFAAVADSSGNIYLTFVDDETTDQISSRTYNGSSWSSAALVANAASANDSYPTLTLDTTNGNLYAFWIDTSTSYIYYSVCDTTTACDSASEWDAETTWQSSGTNTNITSNYSGADDIFAEWTDNSNVVWDKIDFAANNAPNDPTSLAQLTTGDVTISTAEWVSATSIKFSATASDTDSSDTLYLCVEKDITGTGFSNTEDNCGTGVAYSGTPVAVTITISSQTDSSAYHWQARIKDAAGAYSSWVSYGGNAESAMDYGLDTSAPTGGSVYDGTSNGVDLTFASSSLSSLSANWDSFDSDVSGLNYYQYSIGTTAGATDVKDWTNNSTSTSVTTTGLTLQTNQLYYFNIKTTDNAGNTSNVVSSNGQLISPSLSFTISPSSLSFDNLNFANSYTDSQTTTLTTSTNAYNGYVIRAYITSLLHDPTSSHTLANFGGGSYGSPASWGSNNGFGYTSSDTDVQGSNHFGSATLYAPFSTTSPGDIVADHTANVSGTSISNESFDITYKVKASETQPASSYTTTVIYTATASY